MLFTVACGLGSRVEIGTNPPEAAASDPAPAPNDAGSNEPDAQSNIPGVAVEAAAFHILEISNEPGEIVASPTLLLPNRRLPPIDFRAQTRIDLPEEYDTPEPYSWMAIRNPFETDFEITVFQTKVKDQESHVYPGFMFYAKGSVQQAMADRTDFYTVAFNGQDRPELEEYELSLTLDRRLSMTKLRIGAGATLLVYTQVTPPHSKATLLGPIALNMNVRTDKSLIPNQ